MSREEELIHIEKEQHENMVQSLIEYFRSERDENLGNLAAELLLRHILREIAPVAYNQGVRDAARYIAARVDDLAEIEIFIPTSRT